MTSDGTQHLLLAILSRAIRDLCHGDPRVRAEAQHWLVGDPLCVEICEYLGYSLSVLHHTMELQPLPE